MSYTTIKIDNRDTGIRFGYRSLNWLIEAAAENTEVFDAEKNLTDIGMAKLLQCAYRNDCLVKEVKPELPFEKFYEWVEERIEGENRKELADILVMWSESTFVKRMIVESEKKRLQESLNQESQSQTLTQSSESFTVSAE